MKRARIIAFFVLIPLFLPLHGFSANRIIGGESTYVVKKGDSFELIGARFGVHWKNIPRENGLDMAKLPPVGTTLKITTRKIVPKIIENGIVINIPDRTLYFFKDGRLLAIPVGVGIAFEEISKQWQTSTGKFRIIRKKMNPTWYVPKSIQMDAAAKGKPVEEAVPPGPKNPLGRFALVTSIPGLLIHETIWPRSVYRYRSHGCLRLLPEHMEELFPLIEVNTPGEIIYEPVKVAVAPNGRIYLEVRTDVYKKVGSLREYTRKTIEAKGLAREVNWTKVEQLVKIQAGIAEDVSPTPEEGAPSGSFMEKVFKALQGLWQ
jgi:L,D-transpeptidase ErfK/SrfK